MALIWFRTHAGIIDNPRLQKLPDHLFKMWINLQCVLAQEKTAAHGKLPPCAHLAFRLRMAVDETVHNLDLLVDAGLLKSKYVTPETEFETKSETECNGKVSQNSLVIFHAEKEYFLKNWEEKQYKSDSSTERVKRFRQRSRNGNETPPDQIRSDTNQIRSEGQGSFIKEKDKGVTRERLYSGNYDVLRHLTDDELDECRSLANGLDIYHLAQQFNQAIASGRMMEPKQPQFAFKAWIPAFTKGKRP